MNSEVKHASMDMDEQKAWYAAEAGIKYVQAYQKDASLVKEKFGISQKLSDDSDSAAYTLKAFDKTLSRAVDGSYQVTFPAPDSTYTVYSEGVFNGVKKVITKEVVFESSNGSGGKSGGGTSGATVLPGLMSAGTIDLSNYGSGQSKLTGDLYAENRLIRDNGYGNDRYSFYQQNTKYADSLFTEISPNWFPDLNAVKERGYTKITAEWGNNAQPAMTNNKTYFVDSTSVVGGNYGNIYTLDGKNGSGSILYVFSNMKFGAINGPDSGAPFTVVFVNDQESTQNVLISGNVRILAKNSLKLSGGSQQSGKLMMLTNGDLTLIGWSVKNGFISANNNITIQNGGFVGQMMAKGTIYIQGGLDITYNNAVLSDKNFWLPEWS